MTNNVKKNSKGTLARVVRAVLVVGAVVAFLYWPGAVSSHEAQQIALSHAGVATPIPPGHDFEEFRRVWQVEVLHEGIVHSVYVSRFDGQIVRVELDFWD